MRLLVDIGNRRVKWGLADGATLEGPWFLPASATDTVFESAWNGLRPDAIAVCCVADRDLVTGLRAWARRHWGLELHEIRARARAGELVNGYAEPGALGADRWANLLGARSLLGAVDTVIVDAGTAVTVDAVRADGRHLGGAILAGLEAGRTGLAASAPALPPPAATAGELPARDTRAAIAAGTLVGLAGAVERVTAAVAGDMKRPRRLLTGGDGAALQPLLVRRWRYDEALTLRGIEAAAEEEGCAQSP